jgi:hypothetical protein
VFFVVGYGVKYKKKKRRLFGISGIPVESGKRGRKKNKKQAEIFVHT